MAEAIPANWHTRFSAQVRTHPRRAATCVVLLALMGVLWVRAFNGGTPTKAQASGPKTSQAGGREIDRFSAAPGRKAFAEWVSAPLRAPDRDLFAVKLEYFPRDGARVTDVPTGSGFWDQLAKSLATRADQDKARDILVNNLRDRAAKLHLQSTIVTAGETKAMVNGGLVGVGDSVEGFRILKIETRRMIVEREGVKLEVLFKQ